MKTRLKHLVFIILSLFIGIIAVNAEDNEYVEDVNNGGYSIDVDDQAGNAGSELKMTLNSKSVI